MKHNLLKFWENNALGKVVNSNNDERGNYEKLMHELMRTGD